MVNVTVEVDVSEHLCCGDAIERGERVDLTCARRQDPDGRVRVLASHHVSRIETTVRGRVVDIISVAEDGSTRPVLRVPSGRALRGLDEDDDGHLEAPWTGETIRDRGRTFVVTVQR